MLLQIGRFLKRFWIPEEKTQIQQTKMKKR